MSTKIGVLLGVRPETTVCINVIPFVQMVYTIQRAAVQLNAECDVGIKPLTERHLRSNVQPIGKIGFAIPVSQQYTPAACNRNKPVVT
ncbi:hypothetical protein Barb4_04595 [Bacteroidales bacterium Barb4]|nr:hypothetical protein Barb4_04595 [Bacteroidales bacterium Barb4]